MYDDSVRIFRQNMLADVSSNRAADRPCCQRSVRISYDSPLRLNHHQSSGTSSAARLSPGCRSKAEGNNALCNRSTAAGISPVHRTAKRAPSGAKLAARSPPFGNAFTSLSVTELARPIVFGMEDVRRLRKLVQRKRSWIHKNGKSSLSISQTCHAASEPLLRSATLVLVTIYRGCAKSYYCSA